MWSQELISSLCSSQHLMRNDASLISTAQMHSVHTNQLYAVNKMSFQRIDAIIYCNASFDNRKEKLSLCSTSALHSRLYAVNVFIALKADTDEFLTSFMTTESLRYC